MKCIGAHPIGSPKPLLKLGLPLIQRKELHSSLEEITLVERRYAMNHSIAHHLLLLLFMLVVLVACSITFTATTPDVSTGEPLPTALPPSATSASNWIRQQFANAWDIEYPEGWTVNDAGIHEGSLVLNGSHGGHAYEVSLAHPIFQRPDAAYSLTVASVLLST